jgi:hypothetical protein
MKLNNSRRGRISSKTLVVFVLGIVMFPLASKQLDGQQSQTSPSSPASIATQKDFIEEWVYRVQYGHKDEWFRIFKKYQLAILERQKQLGFVKQYTVWAPGLHTSEESRWDYRVIIERASYYAPAGESEDEVAKQLFPDQARFKQEENRRWELTANHWDLPIHVVKFEVTE